MNKESKEMAALRRSARKGWRTALSLALSYKTEAPTALQLDFARKYAVSAALALAALDRKNETKEEAAQ